MVCPFGSPSQDSAHFSLLFAPKATTVRRLNKRIKWDKLRFQRIGILSTLQVVPFPTLHSCYTCLWL